MVVRRSAALLEQLLNLAQGQECELDLVGLDLANIGQRVRAHPCPKAVQLREDGREIALLMIDRMRRYILEP
ncbi:hypothetical protein D3C85_1700870 [compost metagenome]